MFNVILSIVAIFSDFAELSLINRAIDGDPITYDEATANDNRQAAIGVFQLLLLVATAVVFLIWIHRAHSNLPALRATGLKYSPGWAVGGFFVPVVNWLLPYLVTEEIWRASDPACAEGESEKWKAAPGSPIVKAWWSFWVISGVVGWVVLRIALSQPEDLNDWQTYEYALIVSEVASLAAAGLAIGVVMSIEGRQDEKYRRICGAGRDPRLAW